MPQGQGFSGIQRVQLFCHVGGIFQQLGAGLRQVKLEGSHSFAQEVAQEVVLRHNC